MRNAIYLVYTALLIASLSFVLVMAQDKPVKPEATQSAEDKLKLNDKESAALEGVLKEINEKDGNVKKYLDQLRDRSIKDDAAVLLARERWLDALDEAERVGGEAKAWLKAAQNRAGCPDCDLNIKEKRFNRPVNAAAAPTAPGNASPAKQ